MKQLDISEKLGLMELVSQNSENNQVFNFLESLKK